MRRRPLHPGTDNESPKNIYLKAKSPTIEKMSRNNQRSNVEINRSASESSLISEDEEIDVEKISSDDADDIDNSSLVRPAASLTKQRPLIDKTKVPLKPNSSLHSSPKSPSTSTSIYPDLSVYQHSTTTRSIQISSAQGYARVSTVRRRHTSFSDLSSDEPSPSTSQTKQILHQYCSPQKENLCSDSSSVDVSDSPNWIRTLLALLFISFGFYFVYITFLQSGRPDFTEVPFGSNTHKIISQEIRAIFRGQPKRTWNNFEGQQRRIFREGNSSSEPGVVLIGGHPQTVHCLVHLNAERLQKAFKAALVSPHDSHLILRGKEFKRMNSLDAKILLKEKIDNHLEFGGKVVVVYDVDLIPPQATLLLHGLADHENAPFKDVFYFLTVSREYELSALTEMKAMEKLLLNDFDQQLSQVLGTDATKALLARIANTIVLVIPENIDGC